VGTKTSHVGQKKKVGQEKRLLARLNSVGGIFLADGEMAVGLDKKKKKNKTTGKTTKEREKKQKTREKTKNPYPIHPTTNKGSA